MYYCRNCGEPYVTDEAVMCVKCGTARGMGNNYCKNCGKPLPVNAAVCMNCGVANGPQTMPNSKSKLTAGLFAILLGCFGIHNFYLGYTTKAIIQLVLTLIGFVLCCVFVGIFFVLGVWLWSLIEGIMIFTGTINCDAKGIPLTD